MEFIPQTKKRNGRSPGDVIRVYNASLKAQSEREVIQQELLTYPNVHAWACVASQRYQVSPSTMTKFAHEMKLELPSKPPKRFAAESTQPELSLSGAAKAATYDEEQMRRDLLARMDRIDGRLAKLLTALGIEL